MSLVWTVALVLYTIGWLIFAVVTYTMGYSRGWIAGMADALEAVYADGGDADE